MSWSQLLFGAGELSHGWSIARGTRGHGVCSPGAELPPQPRSVPPAAPLGGSTLVGPLSPTLLGKHQPGPGAAPERIAASPTILPLLLLVALPPARPARPPEGQGLPMPGVAPGLVCFALKASQQQPPDCTPSTTGTSHRLLPVPCVHSECPGVTLSHQQRDGRGFGREQARVLIVQLWGEKISTIS